MRRYVYAFILVAFFTLLFWYSAGFEEDFYFFTGLLEGHAERAPILAIVFFVGLGAASAMLSPLSSIPLVPPAILVWGTKATFVLLIAGWLIGGAIAYVIGAYGIHPVLRAFVDVEGKIRYFQGKLSRRTELWLVFLFRLAMPAEIPGYVLGSIRYHFGWYMAATFVSELVFAYASVYGALAVIERQFGTLIGVAALLAAVFVVAFYFFSRAVRGKK